MANARFEFTLPDIRMNTRLLFSSLAAIALAFSGCDKILKPKSGEPQPAAEPAPAAETAAVPASPAEAELTAPAPEIPAEPEEPAVTVNKDASVIVLCYHRFEERPRDGLAITPADFEQQLQEIKDNGYTVIGMQDFLAWRRGEKSIPAKSALITLDDGYVSCYTEAWPILKKFDYPFTMFVYLDYIGVGGKSISWDQLAEMRDGGVDIQSHTWSHQSLRGKGMINKKTAQEIKQIGYEAWLKKEIAGSKEALETRLGIKVNALAYPYGVFSDEAREMVEKSGYEAAFTVYGQRVGFDAPHDLIGRYAVDTKNPQVFQSALKMIGGGDPGAPVSRTAQIAAASMATQPMEGETVSDPRTIIRANLASMGKIDPGSAEMRLSGVGLVPAVFDETSQTISYQPTDAPLSDKHYTVIITAKVKGKRAETRWSFSFDPNAAKAAAPGHDDTVLPADAPAR